MDWKLKSVSGSAVYVEEGAVMKETAGPELLQKEVKMQPPCRLE